MRDARLATLSWLCTIADPRGVEGSLSGIARFCGVAAASVVGDTGVDEKSREESNVRN